MTGGLWACANCSALQLRHVSRKPSSFRASTAKLDAGLVSWGTSKVLFMLLLASISVEATWHLCACPQPQTAMFYFEPQNASSLLWHTLHWAQDLCSIGSTARGLPPETAPPEALGAGPCAIPLPPAPVPTLAAERGMSSVCRLRQALQLLERPSERVRVR